MQNTNPTQPLHWQWAVLFVAVLLLSPSLTSASDRSSNTPTYTSPFQLTAQVDIPVLLTSATIAIIPSLMSKQLPRGNCYPCNPDTINRFDRTTVNHYNKHVATASDVTLAALPLAALGVSLVSLRDDGRWNAVMQDFILLLETLAITTASMQIVKHAFARPRPYMYQDNPDDNRREHSDDDVSSFYSGHTALAFATAASMSYMFSVRHPRNKGKYALWISSLCVATSVAFLRVFAGKHFWTDVITGAIVGTSTGILVPALHRKTENAEITVVSGVGNVELLVAF